jgi:transcriptional regulator with XRE-family HTH domain
MSLSLDSVGKRVAYARKYRSLTQQELADRAGIAQSSLASLEAGRNKGSRSLISLAKALGVPPEWLDSGQTQGKTVQELLLGVLPQDASNTQKSIHDVLKNAVLGEYTSEYQQSEASFSNTAQPIGLKLLAWTARSLLDPDTAYLLKATRDFHIPNLRVNDFLLIEPDAPVEAGCHIVVVSSDDEILLGRVLDTPVSQFLLLATEPGQEQLYPLDASMRIVGVIFSRLQRV